MSCAIVTNHARARIKERTGMAKTRVEKSVELARENGIRREETSGGLRRYIDSMYFKNRSANNIRIWCGFVYIFAGDVLITVIELPQKYRNRAMRIWKKSNGGRDSE